MQTVKSEMFYLFSITVTLLYIKYDNNTDYKATLKRDGMRNIFSLFLCCTNFPVLRFPFLTRKVHSLTIFVPNWIRLVNYKGRVLMQR